MLRVLRWSGIVLGSLVLILGALLAGLWVSTRGEVEVLRTVVDDPSLPRIEVGGVLLHAEAYGEPGSPTVVVLHGGPGGDYRGLLGLRRLATRFQVVFYDQRGSGLSQRVPEDGLTLEAMVEELDGVITRFAPRGRVHLVGHSWGGMLAAAYLARHPERVSRAVLAAPGFLDEEARRDLLERSSGMRAPLTLRNLWTLATVSVRSLHVDGPDPEARGDWRMAAILAADLEDNPMDRYWCDGVPVPEAIPSWRFGAALMPALLSSLTGGEHAAGQGMAAGLDRFEGQVLLLAGECDALTGLEHQRIHAKLFRDARVLVVPGAGHFMFGERPAELAAVVGAFLSR